MGDLNFKIKLGYVLIKQFNSEQSQYCQEFYKNGF